MALSGSPTSRRLDMGRVIQRTFAVLGRQLAAFAILGGLLIALPQGVMAWLIQGWSADPESVVPATFLAVGLTWIVTVVGTYLLQASVVHASVVDLSGRQVEIAASLRVGLRVILPLFGLAIFMSLAVALGLILLIVPGVIMMLAWIVAVPAVVVEQKAVEASLGRSAYLTRNNRWAILALCVAYLVLYLIVTLLVGGIAAAVIGGTDLSQSPVAYAIEAVIEPLITATGTVVGAVGVATLYFELRSIKEGVGHEELAAVFD